MPMFHIPSPMLWLLAVVAVVAAAGGFLSIIWILTHSD